MTARRPGVVLIATLLLIIALELLAAGLVFTANHTTLLARARVSLVQARYASEAAAAEALASWSTRRAADLPPREPLDLGTGLSPGGHAAVQNVAPGLYLISARGTGEDPRVHASSGVLVRAPQLRELWQSFPAALATRVSPIAHGSRVEASAPLEPPPGWTAGDCPPLVADSLAAVLGDTGVATLALPTDDPTLGDSATFSRLGPLSAADLQRIADRTELGALSVGPHTRAGACDPAAPGNWGDPVDQAAPCAGYFPLIFAPGDLQIIGTGQGVLVVAGNLVLERGTRFYGPILVAGHLTAEPNSAVYGAARVGARAGASTLTNAGIAYSACALYRAFKLSPALDRAFRPRGRWWIPLF